MTLGIFLYTDKNTQTHSDTISFTLKMIRLFLYFNFFERFTIVLSLDFKGAPRCIKTNEVFSDVQRVVPLKGTTRWFKTKTHLCNHLKTKLLHKHPLVPSFDENFSTHECKCQY